MDWKQRPAPVRAIVAATVVVGLPVYLWAIATIVAQAFRLDWTQYLTLACVAVTTLLTSHWVVRIPRTTNFVAISDCLVLAITMIFGIAYGVVANGLIHLLSYWSAVRNNTIEVRGRKLQWDHVQAVSNVSASAIYAFAYGSVFFATLGVVPVAATTPVVSGGQLVLPSVLMGLTYFIVNSAIALGLQAPSLSVGYWELWRRSLPLVPLYFLASATGAALIFLFHQAGGPWAFLMAIPILIVLYYAHRFYNEKYEELSGLYMQTLEAFALSIDAMELHTDYKHHTSNHIQRVQVLTLGLAEALEVDEATYEGLRFASVVHDVGKISIPSYILHKPTRLTEREFLKMSTHPAVGAQILQSIDFPFPVADIVRHHHENWDGSGYPDGLKNTDIPLGSRILSVTDCYEALTARRVYRKALTRETALSILRRESYKFDPRVLERFFEVADELEDRLASLEVRELSEPEEHHDAKRAPDIVGVPQVTPTFSSSISEPHREIFTLFEIFQTIGNSLSRKDTLTILASKIEKVIPSSTIVIYLLDETTGLLAPAHVGGMNKDTFNKLTIELGTRLAGWVAANNRLLYNVHPGPDTMSLPESIRNDYKTSILAPLVHEERPLGTIALYRQGDDRYSDDHIRLMEIIANRASIALYNAIRFEETQEDAFTDRLTGLPNSRFLYIFFEQTLSEAKRYGEPLTVIEMDLDDFKSVNDRYGHHSGDRFLKEVGRILKEQMRDSDVLVRYAGDEFIAVLPKTDYEQARQFSYRLQDVVEATAIDVGVGTALNVGISLGLASYPTAGADLESLLMAADKNMYSDKGRRKARRRPDGEDADSFQPSLFGGEESSQQSRPS